MASNYTLKNIAECVITDVQIQRKRRACRSIFIDNAFAFGISEEGYQKFALYKGRIIDEAMVCEAREWDELYQAKQSAMRLLSVRMRGEQELRTKLKEKEFSPDAIESAMAFLKEYNMIDDAAFARAFVHDRLLRKPVGKKYLQMALQAKGVAAATVQKTLSEIITEDVELENAFTAVEKKNATLREADPARRRKKLADFLAHRGFSWGTINYAIHRIGCTAVEAATTNDSNE